MTFHFNLPLGNTSIDIEVQRKEIKIARLKVFADGHVVFSVPLGVSDGWIHDYLYQKRDWIIDKQLEYRETSGIESVYKLKSGISLKVFGQNKIVLIKQAPKSNIKIDGNTISIFIKDVQDKEGALKNLEKWLKSELMVIVDEKLEKLYPIIQKHEITKPELTIRKMKTMWGNCLRKKSKITLNFYLCQAAPAYIEYVILHELIHFLHRNHSLEFYDLLSIYMPDWQERKIVLDYEIIQGVGI